MCDTIRLLRLDLKVIKENVFNKVFKKTLFLIA